MFKFSDRVHFDLMLSERIKLMFLCLLTILVSISWTVASANQCGEMLSKPDHKQYDFLEYIKDIKSLSNERVSSSIGKIFKSMNKDLLYLKRTDVKDLEERLTPYLESLSVNDIRTVFSIFRKGNSGHLGLPFMSALEKRLLSVKNDLGDGDLTDISVSLARLRMIPSPDFMIEWMSLIFSRADSFSKPKYFSRILSAFAWWGVDVPYELSEKFFIKMSNVSERFDRNDMVKTVYALYLQGNPGLVERFISIFSIGDWESISTDNSRHASQLSAIEVYFDKVLGRKLVVLRKFKGLLAANITPPKGIMSDLESAGSQILENQGEIFVSEFQTAPGFYADFYLPRKNRIIQVDSFYHFIGQYVNGVLIFKPRAQDKMIVAILRAFGYEVERWSAEKIEELEASTNGFIGVHGNDADERMRKMQEEMNGG